MGRPKERSDRAGNFSRWLKLQREMHSQLESRLASTLGQEPRALTRYRRAYESEFPAWTGGTPASADLTRRLLAADIMLLGDYHSLPQSQRSALRLLKRLVRAGRRPALGLEMFPSRRQRDLDRYQAGDIDAAELLARLGYSRSWVFPWPPMEILLRFAAYHELPVLALDSQSQLRAPAPGRRDRHAARVLARYRAKHPERPLFVLFGDFHLAAGHLPAAIARELARAGSAGEILRLFQNHEPLFWESLAQLGRCPEILELAGGDLCIQSATPLVKLQSYLHRLTLAEHAPQAVFGEAPPDPGDLVEDLSHEVDLSLRRIARFLHIPLLEQDPARVFWIGQADFARQVARESGWTAQETALVQSAIRRGEDCYLRRHDLAIVAQLDESRGAQVASRILHGRSAMIQLRPRPLADDFTLRILVQALIWLGSKIINPLRKSENPATLQRWLREDDASVGAWQQRTLLLLDYLKLEMEFGASGDLASIAARFFGLPAPLHLELTRAIGRNLGGRLYAALIQDRLDRFWLRQLWFESFPLEGSPLRRYLETLDQLGEFARQPGTGAESERL